MKDVVSPWIVQDVEEDINRRLLEQFRGERDGYIQVGPKKFLLPKRFAEDGANFYNFKPRADDTWVITFPRSGTTLTQELVWLLSNNFDYKTAAQIALPKRFPFLEFSACVNRKLLTEWLGDLHNEKQRQPLLAVTDSVIPSLEKSTQRRFIKSHLPISLLHPDLLTCGAKVIYVARNPKDVAISYYHLHRLFKTLDFVGSFEDFWEHFENDRLMWSPFWEHINEAWDLRHNSNILFIFYEEIQQDIRKSIERIGRFLGVNVTSEDSESLAQHLHITKFRNNPSVNSEWLHELGILNSTSQKFIRNGGSSGTSKPEFTSQLGKRADIWMEKNLKGTSLRFPE